jgi:hypothetical protein
VGLSVAAMRLCGIAVLLGLLAVPVDAARS